MKTLLCLLLLTTTVHFGTAVIRDLASPVHLHGKTIVCYVYAWSVLSIGAGSFDIEDIEPSLCTHLIYCFAHLDPNSFTINASDPKRELEMDNGRGAYKRLVGLKENNQHLKTSIAIGGIFGLSATYSEMASDPELRDTFINSVMEFLEMHEFDGLHFYPTIGPVKSEDRENFVTLYKELSKAFESKGYLLTAALRPNKDVMHTVYDLVQINIPMTYHLDFLDIMTYDYHGSWDGVVNANAPIKGQNNDDKKSIEFSIKYLLDRGVTPSKMILGLPMYGHTCQLNSPGETEIIFGETTTTTTGFSGPFSDVNGFMGYNEICLELSNNSSDWIRDWDEHTSTPYLHDDTRFISYDNPRSIANKVKYALDIGLGGFAAWSIDTDDFRGSCEEEPDTYKDFIERYNKIADLPSLKDAIGNLEEADIENEYYILFDGKVQLQLPKTNFSNYPLLRTVNDAIVLAAEEMRVLEEIERLERNSVEVLRSSCARTYTAVLFYGILVIGIFF